MIHETHLDQQKHYLRLRFSHLVHQPWMNFPFQSTTFIKSLSLLKNVQHLLPKSRVWKAGKNNFMVKKPDKE